MLTDNEARVTIRMSSEVRERIRQAARREGNPEASILRRAVLLGVAEIERHLTARGAALTTAARS